MLRRAKRPRNGGRHGFIAAGVRQELNSAGFHGLDRHWHVALARDEDREAMGRQARAGGTLRAGTRVVRDPDALRCEGVLAPNFARLHGSGAILVMRFDLAVWMYIYGCIFKERIEAFSPRTGMEGTACFSRL